ncbi:acetyl-CoA C-acetyltransferase [Oceanicella sp. SM1341]|uniref:acetyl-CoA C-acetyltransferase n=1 Tax=Oceanicella sp. SM1341 TaxID=1548889 RepID=UPI000E51B43E|nr:acetyl-CoA C-acetyltransferase [Oceanicella sp. SM1341]
MSDAIIFEHVRTPRGRGRPDGALHAVTPLSLAAQTLAELRRRAGFAPAEIADTGLGIVMPVGEQGCDLTRFALLEAGWGEGAAGYQLNRFCTSGLDTVRIAGALVASGQAEAAVGGGVESMSRVPIGSDGGAAYSDPALLARFPYVPNGLAADLMASLDGTTRAEADSYAAESQARAAAARAEGRFARALFPVRGPGGEVVLEEDEAIRPATTPETLAALPLAFEALGALGYDDLLRDRYPGLERVEHIHTGGNSSGIVDGACAVLVGSAAWGRANGLTPRVRIRACVSLASEPHLSLAGVVPATDAALARAGMQIGDIDLFEVNEAFAAVPLRYARHYGIDRDRINANGGAIALGHPLGATGAMLLGTLIDELERRDLGTGLVTLCAAAGQSTAMIVERFR